MISKAEQKLIYPISLILSIFPGKKTAENLSKVTKISGDKMLRMLDHKCVTADELFTLAKQFFGDKKVYFIVDDTLLDKTHSKLIGGSSDNFDSSSKQTYRSLCLVAGIISDGKYAFAIDQRLWVSKKFSTEYKTKVELAQELISEMKSYWNDVKVLMDGLFATKKMIYWLNQNNIKFEMRFHTNRVVEYNNENMAVKDCLALVLKDGWKKRTVKVFWKDMPLYITVVKRNHKRKGFVITYQASNFKSRAKTHMLIYGYRWNIEKFFRTTKQSLGLAHCQSRKQNIQQNHIFNVFYAYAILQFERRKKKLSNAEKALKTLRYKKSAELIRYLSSVDQIFGTIYA
jgi:Transposase DDE domain